MNKKPVLAVCAVLLSVLIMGRSVFASVAVPIFPYVPPSDVTQMDLLFNIFGLTKPAIEDDVKRLQGYWSLIEMVMGASAEATKSKLEQMFEDARTTRSWEIDPETITALNQIGAGALSQGIQNVTSPALIGVRESYEGLMTWNRISESMLPYSRYEEMAVEAYNTLGTNRWIVLAVYSEYTGRDRAITLGFAPEDRYLRRTGSVAVGSYSGMGNVWVKASSPTSAYSCLVYGNLNNSSWVKPGAGTWNGYYGIQNNCVASLNYFSGWGMVYDGYSGQAISTSVPVTAQNAQIADALTQGEVIPITAQTTLLNGQIDDTKPARIHLPASLPVPAQTVADLPAVQEQMGVVPISDDVADTVSQLQTQQAQVSGDTGAFALDLTGYFPFCIPFDIGNLLGAFVAEPEAPVIPFTFPVGYEDGHIIMETYYMDLSVFDTVAYWCRKGELALFVVGLGVVTRQWFLRG